MGAFLAGLIPKFLSDFFLGIFKDFMRKAELKQQGRTEQRLENLEEREGKRLEADEDFRKVEGGNEDLRNDL